MVAEVLIFHATIRRVDTTIRRECHCRCLHTLCPRAMMPQRAIAPFCVPLSALRERARRAIRYHRYFQQRRKRPRYGAVAMRAQHAAICQHERRGAERAMP